MPDDRFSEPRSASDTTWRGPGVSLCEGVFWSNIDEPKASGRVPFNEDVLYFGAIAEMPASDFLELALHLAEADACQDSLQHQRALLRAGEPVAMPFLKLAVNDGKVPFAITGHEGRHRALAAMDVAGKNDVLIPVCMIGAGGLRARHLNDATFDKWRDGILCEDEFSVAKPRIARVIHDNGIWTPGLNRDERYEDLSRRVSHAESPSSGAPSP